ncbi:MAG: type III-B CRISPR-associated protein Cas10/Cmr2 [Candidatus Bathyarchaeia archaeon]
MDELLGKVLNIIEFRFPPLCDIAVLPFKKSLIEVMVELSKHHSELANNVSKEIDEIWKNLAERKILIKGRQPIIGVEKRLMEKIKSIEEYSPLRQNLEGLLYLDSESGIMRTYEVKSGVYYSPKEDWLRIRELINKDKKAKLFGKVERLNTYYAIIRSDADNFGKIIRGNVKEGFRIKIEDYLCALLEGEAGEVIRATIEEKYGKAKELCEKNRIIDIDVKLKEIKDTIHELKMREEIIISPSYHTALSKALMKNAFKDVETIEQHNGLVIYAGGDDLLAVMPVNECLDAVSELRKSFSFPLQNLGFYKIKEYFIPSLDTASRSFSIYLGHYIFPMYIVMNRSAELLDELAKKAKWMLHGVENRRKDTLILAYSLRDGEQSALLPLIDIRNPDEKLGDDVKKVKDLIELIDKPYVEAEFSSSLIYDLNRPEFVELLKLLIENKEEYLLKKIIKNIFYRNCEVKGEEKRKKAEKKAEEFITNYDLIFDINGQSRFYLNELATSLKLYISSLKEAA